MKQLALIAPTASGKTALSLSLASKLDAIILSLDSLSVYKEIDIASAKPTKEERGDIKHFGIDIFYPNETFSVIEFIDEYNKAKEYAKQNSKNLIIVGGTSFYLKALLDGISPVPDISSDIKYQVKERLKDIKKAYSFLYDIDKEYMKAISSFDRYRIEKAMEIYLATSKAPTQYFYENKPKPIIKDIKLFQIDTPRDILRKRIQLRTKKMLDDALIDEVIFLEKKYNRSPNSMQSIGIKESLQYLDGKISKGELYELISTHTAQLAKRQRTFNNSQFQNIITNNLQTLEKIILSMV